ncbi:MAG: hypothetical protein ABSG36_12965, partial [Acidimicrobiales bacterium]
MGAPADEANMLGLEAAGLQMRSETDELLVVRDSLRRCPKCQSDDFVDRKVTRSRPASPDASR